MTQLFELIKSPWPWYISGPLIALVMTIMLLFGKTFGVSSNLRIVCAACGAGKQSSFFNFNWKNQIWNILFVIGAIVGGYFTDSFLSNNDPIALSTATINDLKALGITSFESYLPKDLFNFKSLTSWEGIFILVGGGFMIGFGARYAGGCTSGHAISGLSNLQLPSLIAVIGFFIGGLVMTHLFMPFLF